MSKTVVLEAVRASSDTVCGMVGVKWRIEIQEGVILKTNGFGIRQAPITIPVSTNVDQLVKVLCSDSGRKGAKFRLLSDEEDKDNKTENLLNNTELIDEILKRVNNENKWAIIEGLGALDTYTYNQVQRTFDALVDDGRIKLKTDSSRKDYYTDIDPS